MSQTKAQLIGVIDDTTTDDSLYPVLVAADGIGKKSSTKLYFNPSTGRLSATIVNSLSDEKLKKDISTIDDALDKVKQLRGVDYTWKESEEKSKGVIAQELQEVFPELVSESESGLSVNYNGIIGVLIDAIKDQQKQIDELKGN